MFGISIRTLPAPAKALITAYLLAVGVGYSYALITLALNVGVSPEQMVEHYWGNEATQAALKAEAEAAAAAAVAPAGEAKEEELDLGDEPAEGEGAAAAKEPSEPILTIPTFKALAAEGHFHVLGMISFFFPLALIALFFELKPALKSALVVAPFLGIVLDNFSLMAMRFLGPGFAVLTMAAGTLMACSYATILLLSFYEMYLKKPNASASDSQKVPSPAVA